MATAVKKRKRIKSTVDPLSAELRRIYRDHGRRLHPQNVLDVARHPDSLLHKYFVWDDTEAAELYRVQQARQLIATVRITIPATSTSTQTVRAYHALRSEQSGYRHMRDIVDSPDLLETLVAQFSSDLERVTERYDAIRKTSQARKVFDVIEEFVGTRKAG